MCCLGFYLESCGVTKAGLTGRKTPAEVGAVLFPTEARWLYDMDNDGLTPSGELMAINDNGSEYRREDLIKKIFAENGVEVEFV